MYAGVEYGGGPYAGSRGNLSPATTTDVKTTLAVEVSFTTGPLDTPVWLDITPDVRSWSTSRGRRRELERFQPGRATVVLSNLSRQYDSLHTSNIKPMKRIRIRETFNGVTYPVFDGFVDKWTLNYPLKNKDATCTVTATDQQKIWARTKFRPSVFHDAVLDDGSEVYYRLDETKGGEDDGSLVALNSGSLRPAGNGTYVGPPETMGGEVLVVKDPGGSIEIVTSTAKAGTVGMGIEIAAADFNLVPAGTESFAFEGWCIPRNTPGSNGYLLAGLNGAGTVKIELLYTLSQTFVFNVNHTTPVSLSTSPTTFTPHQRFHVVAKCVVGETLKLWINGVQFTGGTPAGTLGAGGLTRIGYLQTASPTVNWSGAISHFAFYRGSSAAAINQTWVDRHYAAGTSPWQGDLPGARAARVLDEVSIPADLRELDAGITTFQSARVGGQTAQEHLMKVAESEYASSLFVSREGKARFVGRTAALARQPYPVTFGIGVGDVGYTDFVPDDGDENIRNVAKISRLDGVAMTATDATSVDDLGAFEYVKEGLLHNSEQGSLDHANFVVDQYAEMRRRVSQIELGPADPDEAAVIYPAMLGLELGDAVTVAHEPPGGGDPFEQVCVVERIEHAGAPKNVVRTCRFVLSPEYG